MASPRILSSDERSRLTRRQVEVLQQIAAGKTNTDAALALTIAVGTLNRCLIEIGYRLQRSTNASKVDAALSTGQLPCPTAPAEVPDLSTDELALLRVARFSNRDRIAGHAGLTTADVRPCVDALIKKVGAANAAHLVALAYACPARLPRAHRGRSGRFPGGRAMIATLSPLPRTLPVGAPVVDTPTTSVRAEAVARAQRPPTLTGDLLTAARRLRLLRETYQRAALAVSSTREIAGDLGRTYGQVHHARVRLANAFTVRSAAAVAAAAVLLDAVSARMVDSRFPDAPLVALTAHSRELAS